MSCIIKYKGQKYSEEQYKEYFINNKQEFDFSFEFSDKEQEIVDKYSKTERDKSAYKYFKEKKSRLHLS